MFDIIVAVSKDSQGRLGIGIGQDMAWSCPDELKLFRSKTIDNVVIMGRKTIQNLPRLTNRIFYMVTRDKFSYPGKYSNFKTSPKHVHRSLSDAVLDARERYPGKKIFVAGGSELYNHALEHPDQIDRVHISFMKTTAHCDKFLDSSILSEFGTIETHFGNDLFDHYVLTRGTTPEKQYLDLLKTVLSMPERPCRNGSTMSVFSPPQLVFDIYKDGYPLLTTKKMFFRGIVEELLFFLRGDTDSKKLEEKNIRIWQGNTSREFLDSIGFHDRKEGMMGPMYGSQWRSFNGDYDENTGVSINGVDQLRTVIDQIKRDPMSRRILMTTYNPDQATQGVLYPCHSIVNQFYVSTCGKFLHMSVYNRSSDLFLGLPFNIASSALLLILVSKLCNLEAGTMYITLGDSHIYTEHREAVFEQVERLCYQFPTLQVKDISTISDLEMLNYEDFKLENYNYLPPIKAPMVP